MVTEFGKFLRILRISKDKNAKVLAEKLGVSISYLSAVENGKRPIPLSWEKKIIKIFDLDDKECDKLKSLIIKSSNNLNIDLNNVDEQHKNLLFSLARKEIDENTINKLCEIVYKNNEDDNNE